MKKDLFRRLLARLTGRRLPPGTIAVIRAPALSPEEAAAREAALAARIRRARPALEPCLRERRRSPEELLLWLEERFTLTEAPVEAASPTLRRATALSLGQPPEALSPVLFRLEEPSPKGAALLGAGLSPFPWVLLERGSGRFFTNSPALDRALVLAEGLTEEDIARRTTPFWRVLSIVDPQPAPET